MKSYLMIVVLTWYGSATENTLEGVYEAIRTRPFLLFSFETILNVADWSTIMSRLGYDTKDIYCNSVGIVAAQGIFSPLYSGRGHSVGHITVSDRE